MLNLPRRWLASAIIRPRNPIIAATQQLRSYAEQPTTDVAEKAASSDTSTTKETTVVAKGALDGVVQESVEEVEAIRSMQAPNRKGIWSRSQQPREKAMVGPRFEQTNMADQPRPLAPIEVIHKQPVRWIHERSVCCDGGGGPLGHPRIFINLDKPQICWCTYCGLPFANEHHRHHIESLPNPSYPLGPADKPTELP